MPADSKFLKLETYQNPVYPRSFPDPYVLKFRGEYFAYCTDFWRDGRVFGVLRSRDLVNWTEVGGAMEKLASDAPFYWAPEVTYANGKFYLYYSVGNEALMEMRVAVSDRPDGGFVDSGAKLTTEDFAIDGHVFIDDDNRKYFFYATDFLAHSHIGTGTVVDQMTDFFTLEGRPRPVTRAKYDWQVYDPARKEKGGVRWHTVEGTYILKRKGIYYEMFSGGNWQNISYGVSFAVTDDIRRDEEWTQYSDGEKTFPILRTIPEQVVGPGHNSVARGVNNREYYCVYHRWTEHGRVLSIDRMDFVGARIFIKGATTTPQIAPYKPTISDFFEGDALGENWRQMPVEDYTIAGGEIINKTFEGFELFCRHEANSFLCEFGFRVLETEKRNARLGFILYDRLAPTFEFEIRPDSRKASVINLMNGQPEETFELPADFDFQAVHHLRVETDGIFVRVALDETTLKFEAAARGISNWIAPFAGGLQAAFSAFSLTEGFEDLFDWENSQVTERGWQNLTGTGDCRVADGELWLSNKNDSDAILTKGAAFENFEYAVNFRLAESFGETAACGFLILNEDSEAIERITITGEAGNFQLSAEKAARNFALPKSFAPENLHQFRFLKLGGKIYLESEEFELGEISLTENRAKIAVFCRAAGVALEMVRLTVL